MEKLTTEKFSLANFLRKFWKFSPHHHTWVLITRTISEPKNIPTTFASSIPQEFWDKLVFGMTTYLWECQGCGTIRREECRGLETASLDEILDRVDSYGNQQIVRENKVYVVLPYKQNPVAQPVMPSKIPIRRP